jgi:hypothetical protein
LEVIGKDPNKDIGDDCDLESYHNIKNAKEPAYRRARIFASAITPEENNTLQAQGVRIPH